MMAAAGHGLDYGGGSAARGAWPVPMTWSGWLVFTAGARPGGDAGVAVRVPESQAGGGRAGLGRPGGADRAPLRVVLAEAGGRGPARWTVSAAPAETAIRKPAKTTRGGAMGLSC